VEHLAIDLGGRESQICLRAPDGSILREARVPTKQLEEELKRPNCRVVMETCAEAFGVADEALKLGHQTRVVPASLARALGVGARKLKTDQRDARVLSEVSCRIDLPSVHIPSAWARETKSLCAMREALVHSRTMQINTVRGWLRGKRVRLRAGEVETFPARVLELGEIPEFVARQLRAIESLTKEIKAADKDLATRAKAHEICVRLMTVPGVGPQTALRYVAAIDEVSRFASPSELESYLGLTPGENSSSDRKRRTSITKAGSSAVRWLLVEACWSMKNHRPSDPMVLWADKIAQRRGKRIAVIAMARKLAGIMYAMWRDGTSYSPSKSAKREAVVMSKSKQLKALGRQSDALESKRGNECPEAVTTCGFVWESEHVLPIVARQRTSTSAALTANSRLRHLVADATNEAPATLLSKTGASSKSGHAAQRRQRQVARAPQTPHASQASRGTQNGARGRSLCLTHRPPHSRFRSRTCAKTRETFSGAGTGA